MSFDGKVAIITGGARGIGAKTATMFAEKGAHVALLDTNESQLQETAAQLRRYGNEVLTCSVNITERAQVQQAVEQVAASFQKIDILVNCAGVLQDNLLANMTEEEWDFVIDVNLKGSYLVAQAIEPYMAQQDSGKIVFISSQAALGAKGRVNYAASKAGVQGITRTLALELGPSGINVNAVAPGFIDTEMSVVSEQSASKRGIDNFQKVKQAFIQNNPIRRTGKPEDIAYTILFLASEQADYITGQTIYVTGAP